MNTPHTLIKYSFTLFLLFSLGTLHAQKTTESIIRNFYNESLSNGRSYADLEYLCKNIGHRLSGSPGAAAAVQYTYQLMREYGFDTVYLQPVMVPRWVRGAKETVRVLNSPHYGNKELSALAIGNSIGTGETGITAEVVEITSMSDVDKIGSQLKGKIAFFNIPADPTRMETFASYGGAVAARASGASEAARFGALAVVVRSATTYIDDIPHTGTLVYKPNIARIPALCLSTISANLLSEQLKLDKNLRLFIRSNAEIKEEVLSYNVIGQLNGSAFPGEIISVGGHLDSWDVGEGAHDDGAGCITSIEALRLWIKSGIRPKHTLRAVMWMNEENGGAGGRVYAQTALAKKEKQVVAIESDRGGFRPLGFTSTGKEELKKALISWKPYFLEYGLYDFEKPGGGADIAPLSQQGTFLVGLLPDDQRYFKYHHTEADTFETVNQRELELGAASLASILYLFDQLVY